jgi:S1-C subfamily serine protease
VTRVELPLDPEKKEILIGRSPENDVVLPFDFVSRVHARLYFEEGHWSYQDLRKDHPRREDEPIRLSPSTIIQIETGLELLSEESFVLAETKIHDRRSRASVKFRRREDQKRLVLGVLLGVALVASLLGFFKWFDTPRQQDANTIFGLVRPKVVEFVKIKDEKSIRDFKIYGEMKDEDFVEEMGFCTGFKIAPTIVLTANHCVHGGSLVDASVDFQIKTFDGKVHAPSRILGFDLKKDFLFLEVPSLKDYGYLKISEEAFKVGETVFTVGNVAGEGLAIREGITASKTKDQNDPQIEFVRFSAPASGGNSGGPLVNGRGEVVALVFAATWDGNYNMGTGADYLLEAKKKFVDDQQEKSILVEPKKLLNFQPLMIPYQLYMPTLDSAYESPDHYRLLESMSFDLRMPNALESHYSALLDALNHSATEKMKEVEARLRAEGFRSKDWADQVSPEVPLLIFGDTNPVFAKWPPQKNAKSSAVQSSESMIYPLSMATSLPMGPTAYKGFLQTLRSESYYNYVPEQQILNLRLDPTQISTDSDSIVYRAGNFTQREALERMAYEAFGLARMSLQKPEGGWEQARQLDPQRILSILVADGLIASSAGSLYLRPNAQRDFVIKAMQEQPVVTELSDLTGRKWQTFSIRLFGEMTLESFCLPLPQGIYCQFLGFQATHPYLLKILRANFVRSQLSQRALPGFYSRPEALLDFQKQSLSETNPPWNDFELRRDPLAQWRVNFKEEGLFVELPKEGVIESIRMNSGVTKDPKSQAARWVATGIEFIHRSAQDKMKRRYCEFSFEKKGSLTSSVLAAIRAEEQTRERAHRRSKTRTLDEESTPIWQKSVISIRTRHDLSLYAYCVPAEKYGDSEQLLNFSFDSREKWEPRWGLLE